MNIGKYMLADDFLITSEEYLEGEMNSEIKHEYVNGRVFAMSGASRKHNLISMNFSTILHTHLRGSGCQVFSNDMKAHVKTSSDECFYYPDIMVTCQPGSDEYFEDNATLVVEVLSKSTERYDREGKFSKYAGMKTLTEYVLVHQERQIVEIFRRCNNWEPEYFGITDTVNLDSVDLNIAVAAIYAET
jgi:Uma2 family endonuclease